MIKDVTPTLPPTFSTRLILPTLLNSLTLTTMTTSAPSIVPLVVQIGSYVPSDEYKALVLEPLVKLFSNPDRGTRMALLDALPEFADKLDKQMVSDKIWPNLVRSTYLAQRCLHADPHNLANRIHRHGSRPPRGNGQSHWPPF